MSSTSTITGVDLPFHQCVYECMNTILQIIHYRQYQLFEEYDREIDPLRIHQWIHSEQEIQCVLRAKHRQDPLRKMVVFTLFGKLKKKLWKDTLETFLQEFHREEWNQSCNTFIFMSKDTIPPSYLSESMSSYLQDNKAYVQFFHYKSLMFNVLNHRYVPKHEILNEEESKQIRDRYNISNKEFPIILSSDPVAMFIGLRPHEICRITRQYEQTSHYECYRICR